MPTIHRSVSIMAGVVSWIRASTRFDLKTSAGNAVKCKLIEILLAQSSREESSVRAEGEFSGFLGFFGVFFLFFFFRFYVHYTRTTLPMPHTSIWQKGNCIPWS